MSDMKLGNLPLPNFDRPEGLDEAAPHPSQAAGSSASVGPTAQSPVEYDKAMSGLSDHLLKTPLNEFAGQGGPQLQGGPRPASDWLLEQGKFLHTDGHPASAKKESADAPSSSTGSGGTTGSSNASGANTDSSGEPLTNMSIQSMPLSDGRCSPPPSLSTPPLNFDATFGSPSGPAAAVANAISNAVSNPSSIPSSILNAVQSLFNSPPQNVPPNTDPIPPSPPGDYEMQQEDPADTDTGGDGGTDQTLVGGDDSVKMV
jgi:hypothetical protein